MHLIIAKYGDEPERKRIEYIFEKWKDKLEVSKPDGIITFTKGNDEDIYNLIEELYSKTSKNNVSLFRVEESSLNIEQEKREFRLELNEKMETVEKLLNFVFSKQKAVLKFSSPKLPEKTYEVIGKKGKAEISVILREKNDVVSIRINITGYGPVVEFLYSKIESELKYFKG